MATPIITEGVAGPFTMTWAPAGSNPTTLGVVGSRGITEIRKYETEEVPADLVGLSVVDAVHLGSQLFLEFELEEANLLAVSLLSHPFQNLAANTLPNSLLDEGELGIPGLYHTDVYGQIVATPAFVSGVNGLNSAGQQSTPIRTYGLCSLAPGFELRKLLSSRRRTVPLRIRCFPYLDSGTRYVFYTKTALV